MDKTSIMIPKTSHMDVEATNAIILYLSNPLIPFVKESREESIAISFYLLFILSLFLLPLSFLENYNMMQACRTA